VVEARYYDVIADELLAGALGVLQAARVRYEILTVPGALEIAPMIAMASDVAMRAGDPLDAAVALGCVIRGETSHYDIVAVQSARALMDVSLARGLPLGNGVLTVDTEGQAMARARPTQRPTCCASLGSFCGPSTTSAIAKISSSSVNPTSNMESSAARRSESKRVD
jgi:6,7-dimethyl-8-ribityllumazine synthase